MLFTVVEPIDSTPRHPLSFASCERKNHLTHVHILNMKAFAKTYYL